MTTTPVACRQGETAEGYLRRLLSPGMTVFWHSDATREGEPWFRLFVGYGTTVVRITVDVAGLLGCRRLKNGRYAGLPHEVVPALAETLFGDRTALNEEEL